MQRLHMRDRLSYLSLFDVSSQISLEGIHYDRISDAFSDDTIESSCITIALCNKDSNWRIFKEPPLSQTRMLTTWRIKHGNKLQRRIEDNN